MTAVRDSLLTRAVAYGCCVISVGFFIAAYMLSRDMSSDKHFHLTLVSAVVWFVVASVLVLAVDLELPVFLVHALTAWVWQIAFLVMLGQDVRFSVCLVSYVAYIVLAATGGTLSAVQWDDVRGMHTGWSAYGFLALTAVFTTVAFAYAEDGQKDAAITIWIVFVAVFTALLVTAVVYVCFKTRAGAVLAVHTAVAMLYQAAFVGLTVADAAGDVLVSTYLGYTLLALIAVGMAARETW